MARRALPPKHNALVASATRINLDDRKLAKSQAAKRQQWQTEAWCVDDQTEILTRRGWLTHGDLCIGDEALTLNHESGLSEWQPVEDVQRFESTDRPMLRMEGRLHSSLTTLNHRWPVIRRQPHAARLQRDWRTSESLTAQCRLITGAPCISLPSEQKWSDGFVELVAWFWTEGTIVSMTSPTGSIGQSIKVNPEYVDRIRAAFMASFGPPSEDLRSEGLKGHPAWRESPRPSDDMMIFRFNAALGRVLGTVAPDRVLTTEFVTGLTQAQLDLLLSTSVDADGWRWGSSEAVEQSRSERLDPIMLAAVLAGRSPHLYANGDKFRLHLRRKATVGPHDAAGRSDHGFVVEVTTYTGTVWCPVTANSTWLARRNGTTYFTGNTYFYEVPEVGESLMYRANQLAKLRLFIAVDNPDDPKGDPVPATDPDSGVPASVAEAAEFELARLHGEYGGQAEIIRQLSLNSDVAGEAYLVGIGAHTKTETIGGEAVEVDVPESWQVKSISEVLVQDGVYKILSEPGAQRGVPLVAERDDIMRLWLRDPQWSNLPHSPMRGLLGECRTLQVLAQQVLAQAMRSVSAGFLLIPNELSFGPANPTDPDDDAAAEADPLNQALNDVLVRPIDNPSDPSTVQPGVIRGPAEFLGPDMLRRLNFYDAEMDTVLEAKIEARVQRIARGINLPVEVVMGLRQTTFANATQIDENEFNDYLRPSAEIALDNLTYAYLRPQMLANPAIGAEWADRLFLWYDASELISQPDKEKNADLAFDRYAISLAAYRAAKGYGEDDAPDEVETLIRAGLRRGFVNADLTQALLDLLGVPIEVDSTEVVDGDAPPAPEPDARAALLQLLVGAQPLQRGAPLELPATAVQQVTAAARPDYGRMLMDLDWDLRTRLVVAANDAMDRALDRAANVLRSKSNGTPMRATLANVPLRAAFAHLGPSLVAEVMGDTDALEGAWDALREQFMTWGAGSQTAAIDVAGQVAAGFTTSIRSELQLRQAADLGEAWGWMQQAMNTLANARMFDPNPAVPEVGEFDPSLRVPTGLVRQAISRAGGSTGLLTEDGGVWLALTDAGTQPAGGIGTGELLRGAMRDEGVGIEGYEWVYGPAFRARPFEDHLALDGAAFVNFDDPILANTEGFPGFAFFMPGDHAGCCCDAQPILIPAPEAT